MLLLRLLHIQGYQGPPKQASVPQVLRAISTLSAAAHDAKLIEGHIPVKTPVMEKRMNQFLDEATLGAGNPCHQLHQAGNSNSPPGSSKVHKSSSGSREKDLRDTMSSSSEPPPSLSILPFHLQHQLLTHASQQLDQRTCYGIIPRVNRLWDQLSPTTLSSLSLTFTSATSPRYFTRWLLSHPQAPLQHLSLDFKYVDLSGEVSENLIKTISKSAATRQLSSLRLSNLSLSSTHTSSLRSLTTLTALHLRSCDLDAAALEPLLDLKQLKSLDLAFNPLRPVAELLPDLAKALQQLKVLDLSGISLPCRPLAALRRFPSLMKVALPVAAFSLTVPLLRGLLPLPFVNVTFMSNGVGQQDRLACVQQGQRLLESVDLNNLQSAELAELISASGGVGTLRHLGVSHVNIQPAVPALMTLTQLTSLHLTNCVVAETETVGEVLAALPGLRELSLNLPHKASEVLSPARNAGLALPHLTALTLFEREYDFPHSTGVLGPLHRFPELRKLKVHGTPFLDNSGMVMEHVQPLTNLECLVLATLPEAALAEALVPLTKLKELRLQSLAMWAESQKAREQLPADALAFTRLTQLKCLVLSLGRTENCKFQTKVRQRPHMYTGPL